MPIRDIQIKRSHNQTLSSPSEVTLKDGELFWLKSADASSTSGKLYVGDGVTNMSNLKDVGYSDRQISTKNTSDISDIQSKIGNWDSTSPMTSAIQRAEKRLDTNTADILSNTNNLSSLSGLLTDSSKGIYYQTSDGKFPSISNTSINYGNIFYALNSEVSDDFNWGDNINLDNPGEWKSGNKKSTLLHNSRVYGLDARIGKIFDTKFGEKGIFGKDFIIYKTVGGNKQKVLEFIRSDNGNDTARIAGGEVTYGVFDGQNKSHFFGINAKSSNISDSTINNSTLKGTINADGATIQGRSDRVKIVNPSIDNPIFSNGFINKYDYFQAGIVDTNALKDGSVTASKLAAGALQPSKIQGKTGTTSILYSDTSGNVYWGTAPNTSNSATADGNYTNFLAYFKSGKTLGGKVAFSAAKTSRYLNENGTWQDVSSNVPIASSTSAGLIRPDNKDFLINSGTGAMVINKNSKVASSIAILTEYEGSVPTDTTAHYFGKISKDGKTLTFIRAYL